jgi:hypothetical protein
MTIRMFGSTRWLVGVAVAAWVARWAAQEIAVFIGRRVNPGGQLRTSDGVAFGSGPTEST